VLVCGYADNGAPDAAGQMPHLKAGTDGCQHGIVYSHPAAGDGAGGWTQAGSSRAGGPCHNGNLPTESRMRYLFRKNKSKQIIFLFAQGRKFTWPVGYLFGHCAARRSSSKQFVFSIEWNQYSIVNERRKVLLQVYMKHSICSNVRRVEMKGLSK